MQTAEVQQLIDDLINQAESGEHSEYKLITTWAEYRFYLGQQRSLKTVIKVLRNCSNFIFNLYCKEVELGTGDFNKMLAYSQLRDTIMYYDKEYQIIKKMNDEYDNYLGNWTNFFMAIAGHTREI